MTEALSALRITESFLERIAEQQPRLRALVTVTGELARADARRADDARRRGRPLPLDGLPIVVKDNIDVGGVRTTAGSKLFEHRVAGEDAAVVRRLRAAGAVVLGKASLHELAFGGTSRNERFGAVRNPWDPERIPGGSSGGSAAALAADLCAGALGTDTGGSIRIPAAFTGVTGLRPTYGAVSNRGVFPVSWSLDTVGPMARSVADVAALLAVIAGYDPDDPRALPGEVGDLLGGLEGGVAGLRVGLLRGWFAAGVDPEIGALVAGAARTFAELGASIEEVELGGAEDAARLCATVLRSEALALHRERIRDERELFEEGTLRRLSLAESLSAVELAAALQGMYLWQQELRRAFDRFDLLLSPTVPIAPPRIDEADTVTTTEQVVPFTFAVSLGRVPALSIPCGLTTAGLPAGAQLVAPWWRDALLLRAGAAYQSATAWHELRPPTGP